MRNVLLPALAWALAACAPSTGVSNPPPPAPPGAEAKAPDHPEPTIIYDRDAAARLRANSGITLQWIGWDDRGPVEVTVDEDGVWRLRASQREAGGPGLLTVDATVTEIGDDHLLLDGLIKIANTPDSGRQCALDKEWRFAVTQGRRYWRLREFEWCDGLTDYVDIYF